MKYIVSNYNNKLSWLKDYTDDYIIYNQVNPIGDPNSIQRQHKGSDIYDKFSFIIDNYDNLPNIACYIKANLFNFIKPREFEKIKDNKTFTPILTQDHHTYSDSEGEVCYYKVGIYWERNNLWYLNAHPTAHPFYANWLMQELGIADMPYVPLAPGSNYILTREDILKHPKSKYERLRKYLEWDRYPGEAMIIERGLYTLWK